MVQRLVRTELHQNVDVLLIFEEVLELYDVRVLQVLLNVDLHFQLDFLIRVLQEISTDNLGCKGLLILADPHKLVASAGHTSTEFLSLHVGNGRLSSINRDLCDKSGLLVMNPKFITRRLLAVNLHHLGFLNKFKFY